MQTKIVPYEARFKTAFKSLNEWWIKRYFTMEASDYKSLDFPEKNIINKGGYILFAIQDGEPVGVCALIAMEHPKYDFELAKMGVREDMHGQGIGRLVGEAIIEKAKSIGAKHIYLESNTVLEPAINLYRKLGFVETYDYPSPYERCNIQMELEL